MSRTGPIVGGMGIDMVETKISEVLREGIGRTLKPKAERKRKSKIPLRVQIPEAGVSMRGALAYLLGKNQSELVEMCRMAGLRADRSFPKSVLVDMVLNHAQTEKHQSVVEVMRTDIMDFLEAHPSVKADPEVCPRDCSKHPDFFVIFCHKEMATRISAFKHSEDVLRARGAPRGVVAQKHIKE